MSLRHGDVQYGHQHAGEDRHLHRDAQGEEGGEAEGREGGV